MAVNDKVRITEYNALHSRILNILGTGSGSYGYGQPVSSYQIGVGWRVAASHWDRLRQDISSISRHQSYSWATLADIQEGDKVTSSPYTQYNARIDELSGSTRFDISTSTAQTVNKGTHSIDFPGPSGNQWLNKISCVVSYSFSNNNNARYFFNSGGKIRFSSSRTGGTASSPNDAWTSLLAQAGTVEFGANTATPATYYTLTNSYQQIFLAAPSGVYAYQGNEYRISVKCNVADNSSGTASVIYFLVEWEDTDPYSIDSTYGDLVDGTLSIATSTLEAIGPLYPVSNGNTFTVESPTPSFSNFTVS